MISVIVLAGFSLANCQTKTEKKQGIDFSKITNQEIVKTFEKAKADNKLVLLIFDAVWCPYCKRLNEKTLQDSKVLETLSNYEKLNIDIDENSADADFFNGKPVSQGGNGIPTMIIFSPEGKELDRELGFIEAKEFNSFLKKHLKKR
jgi:thiol:disulfide interchange protein